MAEPAASPPSSRARLTTTTLGAFLALGLGGAAIGPSLPWLARRWDVALDAAGVLFTMLFAGSCLTVVLTGLLLDRLGRKPLLVAGLLLMSAGLAGLGLAPGLLRAAGATFVLGCGWGFLDVTLNVFVADLYPAAPGRALNLMNAAFGVGSLAAPLAVGAVLSAGGSPQPLMLGLAGLALATTAVFAAHRFPAPPAAGPGPPTGAVLVVLRDRYVLTLALLFFLYVGLEIGFGGWAYSFAIAGPRLAPGAAALVVSVYWVAFTVGRAGAGLLARRVAGTALVVAGALCVAAGATAIALFSTSAAALFVGAALVGLGCAPVFPTAFGLASARYPAAAGAVSSLAVLGGSLGGAVLPYVQGRLLAVGGVPLATEFVAVTALAIAGLQVYRSLALSGPPASPLREAAAPVAPSLDGS